MKSIEIKTVLTGLSAEQRVIGLKQVLRHAYEDELSAIFLASDADRHILSELTAIAKKHEIPLMQAFPKRMMGKICGIDVSAACVGVLKEAQ